MLAGMYLQSKYATILLAVHEEQPFYGQQDGNSLCVFNALPSRRTVVARPADPQGSRKLVAPSWLNFFQKAAVYFRNIIGDHPFSDGSKRTMVTVCGIFLMRNIKKLSVTPNYLEKCAVSVATNHLGIVEIAQWLENSTIGHLRLIRMISNRVFRIRSY